MDYLELKLAFYSPRKYFYTVFIQIKFYITNKKPDINAEFFFRLYVCYYVISVIIIVPCSRTVLIPVAKLDIDGRVGSL